MGLPVALGIYAIRVFLCVCHERETAFVCLQGAFVLLGTGNSGKVLLLVEMAGAALGAEA